jgi:hypothetical protein
MLSAVKNSLQLPTGYPEFLQELKTRIRGAQIRAAFAVNREPILYIGRWAGYPRPAARGRVGD